MSSDFSQNDQPWAQAGDNSNTTQPGREAWAPGQASQAPGQGGLLGGALGSVRQDIENQISQAIDHYAGQVPGGHQFSPEAKRAISGVIDGLTRQLEGQAASHMGGFGGTVFGNDPGNQGFSGGGQGGQSPL